MHKTLILKDNKANNVEVITYPDGQHNVKIDLEYYDVKTPIVIKCRIKNFAEFEILQCIVRALQRNDRMIKELEFLYLYGLRSDRIFNIGECNYTKDILLLLINNFFIPKIQYYYPHSELAFHTLSGGKLIYSYNDPHCEFVWKRYREITIAGDTSFKKHRPHIEHAFHKERTLSGIRVHLIPQTIADIDADDCKHILILDDMCDGGSTFIAEAQYIRRHWPEKHLSLFVAHGLFIKGIDHVGEHFDAIYTTNSYQDFNDAPDKLTVIDVWKDI